MSVFCKACNKKGSYISFNRINISHLYIIKIEVVAKEQIYLCDNCYQYNKEIEKYINDSFSDRYIENKNCNYKQLNKIKAKKLITTINEENKKIEIDKENLIRNLFFEYPICDCCNKRMKKHNFFCIYGANPFDYIDVDSVIYGDYITLCKKCAYYYKINSEYSRKKENESKIEWEWTIAYTGKRSDRAYKIYHAYTKFCRKHLHYFNNVSNGHYYIMWKMFEQNPELYQIYFNQLALEREIKSRWVKDKEKRNAKCNDNCGNEKGTCKAL